jgi:hypothetical protein
VKTVKLEVRAPEDGMAEFVQAWRSGKAQRTARIGLLNRTDTGHIEFPYQAVKVEFLLQAA